MHRHASCLFSLALLTLPGSAIAQAESPAASTTKEAPVTAGPSGTADYAVPEGAPSTNVPAEDRFAYLSFSPLHLVAPVVELTAEFKLHRRIGVAVIGGYGSIRSRKDAPRADVWEVGGQFITYPVGHFDHGMQLGVEVQYAGASIAVSDGTTSATGVAVGLSNGAFVGYKLATPVGFTFNLQGGVGYYVATGEAHASDGSSAKGQESGFFPLVNANFGWSF